MKNMKFSGLPKGGPRWFFIAVLVSLCLHIVSLINIDNLGQIYRQKKVASESTRVKINLVSKNSLKDQQKSIVEAPMQKTKPPQKARYFGAQDHKTLKETKPAELAKQKPGMDPGQGGSENKVSAPTPSENRSPNTKIEKLNTNRYSIDGESKITLPKDYLAQRKPRNVYESLMPSKQEMRSQRLVGYQDKIDDDVADGDTIDLNTSNYRYIGYFTTVRKAFELVWVYPQLAARNGWQGTVKVRFTILKSGEVDDIVVVSSSGYQILDNAVVEALKLSSPYSPLPEGIGKDSLRIVGSFSYVLSQYANAL